ncbi:hypothetical protein SprV_0200737400 [Sparganum proliferum]
MERRPGQSKRSGRRSSTTSISAVFAAYSRADGDPQHLRHAEATATALERPSRADGRLFYGDVATGSRRQGGQIRRYNDTLKPSLNRLQINPANWKNLARDRPTWRRTVKTGAAIYEANRITAAETKREEHKSQLHPPRNATHPAQPPPTCQRTFRAPIGLVGHLQTNFTTWAAPTVVPPSTSSLPSTPSTNSDRPPEPPPPSSSSSSSSSSPPPPPQRLPLWLAAAAADENSFVENRWCQLRDTVQSTALAVLGSARRQLQDCLDDNDADIRNLLAEKNGLQKPYVNCPTYDNGTAFYRSRRLVQQRLRQMQEAWMVRKVEEIREYAVLNCLRWYSAFPALGKWV